MTFLQLKELLRAILLLIGLLIAVPRIRPRRLIRIALDGPTRATIIKISPSAIPNELQPNRMNQSIRKNFDSATKERFGYRALMDVALPLSATVGCFAITLFTDRTLLMWYGAVSSAASIAAGNLYWATVCIPVTAMGFVTPLVAIAVGDRQRRRQAAREQNVARDRSTGQNTTLRIWNLLWQSVWITVLFVPVLVLIGWWCPYIFTLFGHEEALAVEESQYFRTLLLVAPASMLEAGLTAFFVGQRITKPILRVNILVAIANVLLDVWLIFGGLGLPAMGVIGAALATALAMWLKVVIFAVLLIRIRSFKRYRRSAWLPAKKVMAEIVVPGSTLGIQQLVRSLIFSFILMTIGAISVDGLAATSAALSLYQLITIPAIGLATAVTVITGQAFAAEGLPLAGHALKKSLIAGAVVAFALAALLTLFPRQLLEISIGGLSIEERIRIEPLAIRLMWFAAVYCLADVAGLILGAAAKGIGKITSILVATVVPGILCVTIGYGLSPIDESTTVYWWTVLVVWSIAQAAIIAASVAWEFRRGRLC